MTDLILAFFGLSSKAAKSSLKVRTINNEISRTGR